VQIAIWKVLPDTGLYNDVIEQSDGSVLSAAWQIGGAFQIFYNFK
jgi:hypothetical protein